MLKTKYFFKFIAKNIFTSFNANMQLLSINNYNNHQQNKNTSFCAWHRVVGKNKKTIKNLNQGIEYRNNTGWFRGGKDIPNIIDDLVDIYKDVDHVNVHLYGCSNGSGASSGWMYLVSKYGEKTASKFGPFKAKDIDEYAIKMAKDGDMPIDYDEFLRIQQYTGDNFNKFFHGEHLGITNETIDPCIPNPKLEEIFDTCRIHNAFHFSEGRCVKPKKELTDNIKYSVADIFKDYENIEPEQSVVGTRNFLPYLGKEGVMELFSKLGQQLKRKCSVIIGDYDVTAQDKSEWCCRSFLENILGKNGFKMGEGKSWFIYTKE